MTRVDRIFTDTPCFSPGGLDKVSDTGTIYEEDNGALFSSSLLTGQHSPHTLLIGGQNVLCTGLARKPPCFRCKSHTLRARVCSRAPKVEAILHTCGRQAP